MKLNMGCGVNKLEGYLNVDKYQECSPDLQIDLEQFPWAIEDDQATEVMFNHSLEHMGQQSEVFLGIMKELYRICQNNCLVMINVPHPRHDNYLDDPTHVRPSTPQLLSLFSKSNNLYWQKHNVFNTPLAMYLNVDFEIMQAIPVLDAYYQEKLDRNELTPEQVNRYILERNNVVQEYKFLLRVVK
jgi:hypothetical protein